MNKQQLLDKLISAKDQLKDYTKFIDLFKDEEDPKGILIRLNKTVTEIEMLLKMNEVKDIEFPKNKALEKPIIGNVGSLVRIKPCDEDKTYLGILIGEIALGSSITTVNDKIQLNFAHHNPAILVPELNKVIYGSESWWSEIESEDELKEITNEDIENVWYVKMLSELKSYSKTEQQQTDK